MRLLSFNLHVTLKVIAEEAKEKYPYAMSLQATFRTYRQTLARVESGFSLLVAFYIREIQTTIARAFYKTRPVQLYQNDDVCVISSRLTDNRADKVG